MTDDAVLATSSQRLFGFCGGLNVVTVEIIRSNRRLNRNNQRSSRVCVCALTRAGTPVCCNVCCMCAAWPGGLATVHHLHECIIAVRSPDEFAVRLEDR